MALIECPNCSKQISDKALSCPTCGTLMQEPIEIKESVCPECGCEISDSDAVCKSCGCPLEKKEPLPQKVEVTGVKILKLTKKKKSAIIISCILVVLIIIGSIIGINISNKNNIKNYEINMSAAASTMLIGASTAETAGRLIHDVWYNTIYEKFDSKTDKYTRSKGYGFNDDFNDSLQALFADSTFKTSIDSIKDNQDTVNLLMKELTNPPEQYKDAYSALKNLYDAYLKLTNLVINPTGSLQSFTSNYNNADSETANCYKAMQMYIK